METKTEVSFMNNLYYLFKFSTILIGEKKEKLRRLQQRFIDYRDAQIKIPKREETSTKIVKKEKKLSKGIHIVSKKRSVVFPLLVLFDAENMPIQENYGVVTKIIKEKFGKKSLESAIFETAYKESTESYNNKGYNQNIKVHYVDYGKDKADDKLVEIAKEYRTPHVIIVTNDKGLIARLQKITTQYTAGKLFVYNGLFLKEYTLNKEEEKALRISTLKERRERLTQQIIDIDKEIDRLSPNSMERLFGEESSSLDIESKKLKTKQNKNSISTNLQIAILDKNIKDDLLRNPLFKGYTQKLSQIEATSSEEIKVQALRVLDIFEQLPLIQTLLKTKGLDISVFKIALRYAIRDFNLSNYKQSISFTEFIQEVIKESNIKLIFKQSGQYRLFFKETPINELAMNEVIEVKNYDVKEGILTKNFSASFDQNLLNSLKNNSLIK